MTKALRILVVDDEPTIRTLLRSTLTRADYDVVEAASAKEAAVSVGIDKPDLVLLDLGLPDRDGLEMISAMRGDAGTPVIVVSAREQMEQKVAALDLGADDYVTKPFDTLELLARIRAAFRRKLASSAEKEVVEIGDIHIDLFRRIVRRGPTEVHLTPKEYSVLAELARHPGRVLTHAHLLRSAWGPAQERQTEYLRVTMRALRQKLEDTPSDPKLLINEPGVGYRLMQI
ncbi:response regulator transcription factor [Sphingomonas sp. LY29]|uniref:response regulator transcription factor n=1 Tax=Sphingomonas sp. LY29 TaxID=3095341 RepID=UPI002D78B246|nr:response regulator transcription factor [Sphingomonas sp. LY29]WRP25331.1 response regulator transcription factor [Sphingomonas sp. LY29]